MNKQYFSDKSVAKRYDIAKSTVWLRVRQGKLPEPIKIHGNSTRWTLESLIEFEQKESV